jgi:hypothetical protein
MKHIIYIAIFVLILGILAIVAQETEESPKLIVDPICYRGKPRGNELLAIVSNFYIELQVDSNAEGYVLVEFNKKDSRKTKIALLKDFNRAMSFRKMDKSRFTFVISDSYREELSLWIVPKDAKKPENPDGNTKKPAIVIKGENLRKEMNKLFKKK